MKLTKKSETGTKITFTYDKPPGPVEGYLYYADGARVSRTFNPNDLEVTFGKVPSGTYAVEAVGFSSVARAEWPESSPTFPTPPAPPVGPFTVLDGNFSRVAFDQTFLRTAGAASLSKTQVQEVTGYGIGSMQFQPPTVENTGLSTFTDCRALDVLSSPPGKLGGTGEANFWFGNRTQASRLYAARTGWMGMFTGNKCHNSIIEDFEIEDVPVGVYIEHVTHDTVFRRFKIHNVHDQNVAGGTEPGGVLRARSISVEWWYGGKGSYNLTFEDGDIYCPAGGQPRAGVYVDAGTYGVVFRRCRFWGPGTAVYLPTIRVNNGPDAVFESCVFEQDGPDKTYHSSPVG